MTVKNETMLAREFSAGIKGKVFSITVKEKDVSSTEYLLRHLTMKLKMKGIYVSYNRGAGQLISSLKDGQKIAEKLFIIDATGSKAPQKKNVALMQSPSSLTELSILFTKITHEPEYQFIFFDTVSALIAFNGVETSERFMRYLGNKLRSLDMAGVMLFIADEQSGRLLAATASFTDKQIIIN